jgi:hypothetical protein
LFAKVHINDVDKWEKEVREIMDNGEPEQILGMAVRKFVQLLDLRDKIIIFWATVSHHLGWEYLEDMANMDLKIVTLFKDIIDRGYRTGQFKTINPLLTAINIEVMCHAWVIKGWYLYQFYTPEQYAAICEQHAVLMARGASDLKIPAGIEYPVVEVQQLKGHWNRRRKEKPEGHGSDSWVRSRAKVDHRST